jgi:hypothetical protein
MGLGVILSPHIHYPNIRRNNSYYYPREYPIHPFDHKRQGIYHDIFHIFLDLL